ncbi:Arylsulfatase [Posidoniimonas corsicana]|uniref:Arylsulfatase n=1 Tax=Posidoniimonas corsicana TaxID=1938618 RepID=A0A5C5V5D7_9BACT|nr:sulfatase-like hydrolase/transferase [Posidoniimonas corsicana]TWT33746.1 Arylsulfatase [Posidoniimonas corsicana]
MLSSPAIRCSLLILAASTLCPSALAEAAPGRPNLLLVFIDDMGWGDLSCFREDSAPGPTTEHIDRLAAEGLRFTQFYVNSPICSPSRCAITTGQYPQRWRITSYLDNRRANKRRGVADWLDPEAPTLARELQRSGYATGHFGKWHLGGQRDVGDAPLITRYGYDQSLTNFEGLGPRVLPLCDAHDGRAPHPHALGSDKLGRGPIEWRDRAYVTQAFTESAIRFIQAAAHRGQPFYVNLWPDDVHSPFFPPADLRGDGGKRARYHGVLDAMDQQLGELFTLIRDDPRLRDNTLILVCSDNGPEPGAGSAGPLRGVKATLYEGGVRSPLIAWGPGVLADGVRDAVNDNSVLAAFDLPPTLLAIAGIESPLVDRADGQPLPDVIRGASRASHQGPIFFRRPPDRNRFGGVPDANLPDLAVRDGRWKLLCEYDGADAQLYDLGQDPGETTNVAGEHSAVTQRLTRAAVDWHAAMPPDRGPELQARAAQRAQ